MIAAIPCPTPALSAGSPFPCCLLHECQTLQHPPSWGDRTTPLNFAVLGRGHLVLLLCLPSKERIRGTIWSGPHQDLISQHLSGDLSLVMKRQPSPPWDGGEFTNEPETSWIWREIGRDNCFLEGGGAQVQDLLSWGRFPRHSSFY